MKRREFITLLGGSLIVRVAFFAACAAGTEFLPNTRRTTATTAGPSGISHRIGFQPGEKTFFARETHRLWG